MRTKTPDQLTIEALQASLADKEAIIQRLCENQDALVKADPGVGGVYVLQSMEQMANSDLLDKPGTRFNMHDDINVVWSRNARFKFRISGNVSLVKAHWFRSLPGSVRADSWWHVCAQVGLTEPLARLFYHHPENGQESAVAKAKPVQRGPIITCQGDYID